MTERVLGIVGGVGPESTADYYRRLLDRWKVRRPDSSYPTILLNSLNGRAVLGPLLAGDLEPTVELFDAALVGLAAAGAGLAIVASVTAHLAFERVAAKSPIPMLSIVDAIVAEATRRGIRRPGVIATRPTTEGEFFSRPFEAAGIELIRPTEFDRAWVHEAYFGQLVRGDFRDETREGLVAVIERMRTQEGIDAVVLGGTELPLILREQMYAGVPVLDATGIHVEAALDWMLGGELGG